MSAYTFPFGQTAERRFHTCQVCCHAVFQNLSARRWKQMMYASAERRLVDKWARIGKGVTEEFILNERIVKKILKDQKYSIKSTDSSCSGHLSLSLSLQLFICYNLTLLRGWQTDQQQYMPEWPKDRLYHILCTLPPSDSRALCR